MTDGEYDACGNELRKEAEAILDKYLKGLNTAAETGDFEPLTNKLNQALKKITNTHRRDFEKLFVNKDRPLELIKKLQTNYSEDDSLDANQKGRLNGLQKELITYLIRKPQFPPHISALLSRDGYPRYCTCFRHLPRHLHPHTCRRASLYRIQNGPFPGREVFSGIVNK